MEKALSNTPDVLVVGSGIGGATLARRLTERGAHVLMLERGPHLPREADNWSLDAVFRQKKYTAQETWLGRDGRPFPPAIYYFVGGSSKFYGCNLIRFRERDFEAVEHMEGVSPAWPISYGDLSPYYDDAERMYRVHGQTGADPTDPPRSGDYPFEPVRSEPPVERLMEALRRRGVRPFPQPASIELPPGGHCIRCDTCDGYPCKIAAKNEAETCGVEPALRTGRLELRTETYARRLLLAPDGRRVTGVEVESGGSVETVTAPIIVVACSAVNSAALLLRSATEAAPAGVANRSDVVGRHYMAHNNTALMAVGLKPNPTVFQKTIVIHDFYFGSDRHKYPLGALQLLGKLKAGMLTASNPFVPAFASRELARRSFDWWVMSEDLPAPDNRVTLDGGKIKLSVVQNNLKAHRALVRECSRLLRSAGLPLIITKFMDVGSTSHQCGTVRFGTDPAKAALDPFCRSFDHPNLFVMDASFFPSSSAVNPALTIAAQALRVADHMLTEDLHVAAPAAPAQAGSVAASSVKARAPLVHS